ncbi:hypothetical protein JTB14_037343 [Gonioctena quinquepunctata]|nr:hypothetical protein JTB14_037343 [Gonioctena quinquepunctata]
MSASNRYTYLSHHVPNTDNTINGSSTLIFGRADAKSFRAVADGMKVFTASKTFCVPKTTLLYKSTGVYPIERKIGPETVLSTEAVRWILHVGNVGFPVTKTQLLDSVEMLVKKLKRTNRFTNGRPGRHWYEAFLRRHPEVSLRTSQNLTHSRASISEQKIRQWFSDIGIVGEVGEVWLRRSNFMDKVKGV